MKKITTKLSIISVLLVPAVTFAQQKDLKYIIDLVVKYFIQGLYLIMGLAVVMFVWNVYKYFIKGGDDVGAKKEAGLYVLWSVVGFFVILSFWGIVNILTNTFKLDNAQPSGFFGTFGSSSSDNPYSGRAVTNSSNDGKVTNSSNDGKITNSSNTSTNKGIIRRIGSGVVSGAKSLWGVIW